MSSRENMGNGPYGQLSTETTLSVITNVIWSMASTPEEAKTISMEAAGLIHMHSCRGDEFEACKGSFIESADLWMDRNEGYYAGL